jgi:hypothetical protein
MESIVPENGFQVEGLGNFFISLTNRTDAKNALEKCRCQAQKHRALPAQKKFAVEYKEFFRQKFLLLRMFIGRLPASRTWGLFTLKML